MSINKKNRRVRAAGYAILSFCCLFTLLPCALIIMISLRTKQEMIRQGAFGIPEFLHWENYTNAWRIGRFSQYFMNSVIVSVFTVAGVLFFALLAAYAFSSLKFRGRAFLETLMMLGLILPLEIVIIPLFYDLKSMGLMDTLWAVILPEIAMSMAFGIFLLRGFIKDIPDAMLEAARIDGSNEWQNLRYIIVPLIVPALISLLIFVFMSSWNGYILPNIMIKSESMRTLPLGLDFFRGKNTQNIPLTAAASNIIAMPVVAIYLIFQRSMIRGMMVGAVKE